MMQKEIFGVTEYLRLKCNSLTLVQLSVLEPFLLHCTLSHNLNSFTICSFDFEAQIFVSSFFKCEEFLFIFAFGQTKQHFKRHQLDLWDVAMAIFPQFSCNSH